MSKRGIIFLLIIIFVFLLVPLDKFLQQTSESFGKKCLVSFLPSFLQTARGFDGQWGPMWGSLQVEPMSASPSVAPQASRWGWLKVFRGPLVCVKKNLLVVQLFLKVSYGVVRGAWRIAHVDTTSSTGRESVRLPILGIIHLDASPSVFQRAGR